MLYELPKTMDVAIMNNTNTTEVEDTNSTDLHGLHSFILCLNEQSKHYNINLEYDQWLSVMAFYFNASWLMPENGISLSDASTQSIMNISMRPEVNSLIIDCKTRQSIDRPYLLVWWKQLIWTAVFGAMLAASILGNIIVMWIIFAHRRMRTVTNYFLMNLSVADLLMSVLNCMFNFIFMLHSDWPFGATYCIISNFMANVTIAASVFTLTAISIDRYIAIVKPLEPRMSKTVARVCISTIWTASMLLAIPCLIFSTTVSMTYKNNEIRRGCILQWPDGGTYDSKQEHIYNIIFFITTYLLPMIVMLVCYSLIGKELWGSKTIGEMTERQVNSIQSKRRVVRMFMVIVGLFGLCWAPQQGFYLYQYHNAEVMEAPHIQHIYLSFYWLAMANAMINPLIYYWMNSRFRAYFREAILHCVCFQWPRKHTFNASPVLPRRDPPLEENSSRSSRTDSRTNCNRTRTIPASLKSKNHLLLYSSRERLHQRNGWWRNNSKPGFNEAHHSGEGSSDQCNICMQRFKPAKQNCNQDTSLLNCSLPMTKVMYSKSTTDLVKIEKTFVHNTNYSQ